MRSVSTVSGVSSNWAIGAARRLEDSSQAASAEATSAGVISSSRTDCPSRSSIANTEAMLVPGSTPALAGVVVQVSPRLTSRVEVGPSRQ